MVSPETFAVVATVHLRWDPLFPALKAAQALLACCAVTSFVQRVSCATATAAGFQPAVVLAGDFNSTPASSAYELLSIGEVSGDHPELRGSMGVSGRSWCSPLPPLRDVYRNALRAGPLPCSTHADDFQGCVDYIWVIDASSTAVTSGATTRWARHAGIEVLSVLQVPLSLEQIPNSRYPSDHMCIAARLRIARWAERAERTAKSKCTTKHELEFASQHVELWGQQHPTRGGSLGRAFCFLELSRGVAALCIQVGRGEPGKPGGGASVATHGAGFVVASTFSGRRGALVVLPPSARKAFCIASRGGHQQRPAHWTGGGGAIAAVHLVFCKAHRHPPNKSLNAFTSKEQVLLISAIAPPLCASVAEGMAAAAKAVADLAMDSTDLLANLNPWSVEELAAKAGRQALVIALRARFLNSKGSDLELAERLFFVKGSFVLGDFPKEQTRCGRAKWLMKCASSNRVPFFEDLSAAIAECGERERLVVSLHDEGSNGLCGTRPRPMHTHTTAYGHRLSPPLANSSKATALFVAATTGVKGDGCSAAAPPPTPPAPDEVVGPCISPDFLKGFTAKGFAALGRELHAFLAERKLCAPAGWFPQKSYFTSLRTHSHHEQVTDHWLVQRSRLVSVCVAKAISGTCFPPTPGALPPPLPAAVTKKAKQRAKKAKQRAATKQEKERLLRLSTGGLATVVRIRIG